MDLVADADSFAFEALEHTGDGLQGALAEMHEAPFEADLQTMPAGEAMALMDDSGFGFPDLALHDIPRITDPFGVLGADAMQMVA